ncbi:MAG: hypothetical protein IJ527_03535 [Prevotella sp.]|nr:hypothetical protein [Prevotella sp.]
MMVKKNTFSTLEALRDMAISPGSVFLGPWDNIDHEKFIVVAGVAKDKVLVCSVLINSLINQYIQRRPRMLACQVEVKAEDYDFLSHNSYINCAQPIKAKYEHFKNEELKYCGMLTDELLMQVRQTIIDSDLLTNEEIEQFFG